MRHLDHDSFASMEKSRAGSIFDIVQHSSAVQDVAQSLVVVFLLLVAVGRLAAEVKSSEKGEQYSYSADNEPHITHTPCSYMEIVVEEGVEGGNAEGCGYENEHKIAENFGGDVSLVAEDDDDSVKSSEKDEQHSYFADNGPHIFTHTPCSSMEIGVEEGVGGGNAEECGYENEHKKAEKFGGDVSLVRVAYEERRNDEKDAECRGEHCD